MEPDTKEAIAELSPELIEAAVERAKQELEQRKRFEYEVWRSRKSGVQLSWLKSALIHLLFLYRGWHQCPFARWHRRLLQQGQSGRLETG